jgi:hypothetical protein
MIQRIQTLFLLVIVVLSGLMLTGDLVAMDNGTGTIFSVSFAGLGNGDSAPLQRLWPLSAIILLVPLLSLVSVFMYKRRKIQMRLVMLVLLFSLGTLFIGAFYVIMFDKKFPVTVIWKVKALFPLISAILAWLAYRGILKDDMLVKSYDRLR